MAKRTYVSDRPGTRVEIMLGRGLAMSMRPNAAWDRLSPSGRALMVLGYAAFSYGVVLGALAATS